MSPGSLKNIFGLTLIRFGVLPYLLVVALAAFSILGSNFLSLENMINVARQSVYLLIVSLGQLLALVAGGLDLSLGSIVALTSVTSAIVMSRSFAAYPDAPWLAITLGSAAGLFAGTAAGIANGLLIAFLRLSPFMVTLGMSSIAFGLTLFINGGVPISGLPDEFGDVVGFGKLFGIPSPVLTAIVLILILFTLANLTRFGRHLYAVGGNLRAAELSGIGISFVLFWAYTIAASLAAAAGLLLTARLGTGEANVGTSLPLESIAACVIAGVSLKGGVGRVGAAVLGAVFITLVQNGMNLAKVGSFLQIIVLGALLILAVVADHFRARVLVAPAKS
jgi:ribose/xylose/arabinose/galactoside ABC-type transport system permease subunit